MPEEIYLVSACLLGLPTRYDGGHNCCDTLRCLCRRIRVIPVCPEQLGGLPTPRLPAEINGGDGAAVLQGQAAVLDQEGCDLTVQFIRGAAATLQMARFFRVSGAILKTGSPSCGAGLIRDGSFSGRRWAGDGVTAALLKKHGIPLFSETVLPTKNLLPDRVRPR